MSMPILSVKKVACYRQDKSLFRNINFRLHESELLQIVGCNGAGKTTLLRILTGIFQNYEGEIDWHGISIKKQLGEYTRNIFYLGHRHGIKNELTVYENIRFDLKCQTVSKSQILSAIEEMGLNGLDSTLCGHLSQGQRQRVALSKLILAKNKLWVLDEPFASLDLQAQNKMQQLLQQKISEGGAIIFTSHQPFLLNDIPLKILELSEY